MATVLTPTVKISAPEDSTSITLATIVTKFQYLSPKQTYFAVWTYSPTGQFNNATTIVEKIRKSSSAQEAFSVTKFLSDLKPDTGYIIQVDVYEGSINNNNIVAMDSTSFGTKPLGGSLDCVSKSASVIAMAFTGLNPLEFEARVDMIYKKSGDADKNWKNVEREVISVGETKNITHMFTGLTSATSYDFKVILYKGNSTSNPIATYTKTISTKAYLPDSIDAVPSFKEIIIVPYARKGYISAVTSEELPSGCSVHLYESSDRTTYADIGEMNFYDGIYYTYVEKPTGLQLPSVIVYYKLVIVDQNEDTHEESDSRRAEFGAIAWALKYAGTPFDLTARKVGSMTDALISFYRYADVAGEGDVPIWDAEPYYERLVAKRALLTSGALVEGGEDSGFVLSGSMAYALLGLGDFPYGEKGTPISAEAFNDWARKIMSVLGTIID